MVSGYKNALVRLWDGRCDVYIREAQVNPANGRNEPVVVLLHQGVPCRLSYHLIAETSETDGAAKIAQTTKLFLSKDVEIPPGSKLVVTQNEKTVAYSRTGQPAVYSYHQEIMLKLFERWA